jgi:DNA polymerase-3 subunit beta
MKIRCSSDLLRSGVNAVQSIAQTRISNPIAETILLTAKKGIVEFLATDLSIDIKYYGEADVQEEGEVAVPSRVVQDLVRELYGEETYLELTEEGVEIRCGAGNFRLQTLDPVDVPRFKSLDEGKEIKIEADVMREAFRRTVFATTVEESRFELDGVKLDLQAEGLFFVASDGRRLSKVVVPGEDLGRAGAVVPTRAVEEIGRVLPPEGTVRLVIGDKKVMVEGENFGIVAGLLRDKFPPYEQIIPKEFSIVAEVDNEMFLQGVRSATVMARERGQMIRLVFESGTVTFVGEQSERGAARFCAPVDYSGGRFEVGFRSIFLLDYLKVCGPGKTKIHLTDQERASVFIPDGADNFLHLIMPMKIEESKRAEPADAAEE